MRRFLPAKPKSGGKGSVYYTYLSVLLAAACVPVLILSGIVYGMGTREISREITSIQQKQIEKNAAKIEDYFSLVELMATQWANNPLFGTRLKDLETGYDYHYILELFNALFTMEGSSPLVHRAFLYLDDPKKIITHEGGVRLTSQADSEKLHGILSERMTAAYWVSGLDIGMLSTRAPILVYRLPVEAGQPYAALILVLNAQALSLILSESNLSQKGLSLLLDEKGTVVSQLYEGEQSRALKTLVVGNFSAEADAPGSGPVRVNGESYLVSHGKVTRLGAAWTYVNATSLTELNRPVTFLSQLILGFGLIGLAVAVVLSLVASRTVYRPIERLLHFVRLDKDQADKPGDEIGWIEYQWNRVRTEMEQIREGLNEQRPQARAGFLLELLLGYTDVQDEELMRNRMGKLGWNVTDGCRYRVILFRLEGFSQSGKRFLKGDEQLATFAAANMIGEISAAGFAQRDILNFQDLMVAMLLVEPADTDASAGSNALYEMSGQITDAIVTILGMQVTIIIGRPVYAISDIPVAFEESRSLLSQRKPQAVSTIVDAQDYALEEDLTVYYPFALEQEIVQALRRGEEETAMLRVEQFCLEIGERASRESDYYQCLLQLLGAVRSHMLRVGYNPFRLPENGTPYEQVVKLRDTGEIVAWFRETAIRPFLEDMRRRDSRHDRRLQSLVQSMIEKVHAEYRLDLSLDAFADEHGVSSYTLSRIFRQETASNFIDYLTHVRLEASKKLLADTDMPIQEIAESVGYRHTYYYRIFKKTVGLTPSQYRTACEERK